MIFEMIQLKNQQAKRIRFYACSKYFKHYFSLMQHRRAKHQNTFEFLVKKLRTSRFPNRVLYMEITSFSVPFRGVKDVIAIKGNFWLWRGIGYKYRSHIVF